MLLPHKQQWRQAGYTLVELMVAVALTGIVTTSIYKGYVSFSTAYDVQDQVVEVQQNAQVAMRRMVREIRMAGYDPTDSGTVGISALSDGSQIVFSRYDDGAAVNTITTYELSSPYTDSNGVLTTDLEHDGNSIIQNVDALDFVYKDADGNTVAPELALGVMIAIVVRSTNEDYSYTDTRTYTNQEGTTILAPADYVAKKNFRRRLLTAIVGCRNLGM